MRRLGPILLVIAVLLFTATEGLALPPFPRGENEGVHNHYHNCHGTASWADGEKYVGEWRNGKRHGKGTKVWANGRKYVGEWKNNKRQEKIIKFLIIFLQQIYHFLSIIIYDICKQL